MIRRIVFSGALLSLLSLPLHAASRSNVLFIMADDLRPELGCYGSVAVTPNLDALARRGVLFRRAYCQQAVCNPSRSSMLTGLRPGTLGLHVNGTHFRELKPDVITLPLWMKEHGYTTRCVGKIFHNWHTKERGDPRSWTAPEFLHYANHGDDIPQVSGTLPPNLSTLSSNLRKYGKVPMCECREVPDEAYYDGRVAAEAVRVLGEVKDRPFFLAVGFWKPHAPFNAPKKYWDMYERDKLPTLNPERPVAAPEIAFHQSTEILGPQENQKQPTSAQAAEMRHGYFAGISYMDAQVGKVTSALEKHGLLDSTMIVFWGDHGYHIGEHGLWAKTSNFELDARVPLIIAPPQAKHAGSKTDALVEMIDLFPTITALCGVPDAPGLEGVSLMPVLDDPQAKVKNAAFTQHPRPAYPDRTQRGRPEAMGVSVRTATLRYTEWRNFDTGAVLARELYDHTGDNAELFNVIDHPEDAAALESARRLLHDQFPLKP
ncbi:sulfatase [Prosthecobacter sp.]|uniref:sulfatase n=1 Tax=Prosthecobacter sp. TaxID=1965333 RepID=UPI002AB92F02|nr:sulfatase [Prosthecobacter sp.]MDZ4404157.1 sulfatase [Prosthecobacter sp.]